MPRLHFPGPSTLMEDPLLPKAKEMPRLLKINAKPGKIYTRLYQETPAIAEDSPILMTKNYYKVFAKARGAIAIRANNRC